MLIFAADSGEKSWIHDALAYYFALYRKDLGNLNWNSSKERQGGPENGLPVHKYKAMHTLYGVSHSYK